MILFALAYLVLILILSLVLDLRRAYIMTSPLPIMLYFVPLMQLFAVAMSICAILLSVPVFVRARGSEERFSEKLWIALFLNALPLFLLLIVIGLDKIF